MLHIRGRRGMLHMRARFYLFIYSFTYPFMLVLLQFIYLVVCLINYISYFFVFYFFVSSFTYSCGTFLDRADQLPLKPVGKSSLFAAKHDVRYT